MSEIQNSSIFSLDDVNEEEMNNLIDGTITDFDEGDLVNGTVVKIEHDEVLVDIGFKSEGVIPVRELSIRKDAAEIRGGKKADFPHCRRGQRRDGRTDDPHRVRGQLG